MTARGCVSNVDHTVLTKRQLKLWGVKHHELLMNIKPHAHWFIDDKEFTYLNGKVESLE